MNQLNSVVMTDPFGKESVCAQFVVEDTSDKFLIPDALITNTEYTIRCWVKCEGYEGDHTPSIILGNARIEIGDDWTECQVTFISKSDGPLQIDFQSTCTYYIYHLQLEQGNRATDWAPAPEDAEEAASNAQHTADEAANAAQNATNQVVVATASIELLRDQIRMLVVDENGESMMTQTGDGFRFDFLGRFSALQAPFGEAVAQLENELGSTDAAVAALQSELNGISNYVKIATYNDGVNTKPCIELGGNVAEETEQGGISTFFKLLITNTSVVFFDGASTGTEIDTDGINTDNITYRGQLAARNSNTADGAFVWTMRQNGNYGLTWKEVTS